ncbi:hypothetical protein PPL_11884 [Heterostelium album PN500]|uniref:Serine hydrolase domain-containing protein n=1 Tax=Heterostelium pallidum (strain ATCC 26659 / Pp 5 / PN500) TaxID=670386 RepID=D3BUR2_HETP5|nr:hypothetical protein PPL_11884 [Heterostelium album PN500]EFA74850.1 hypothetical protein PPL_11884 [Heterostelium album PN500]|eukprot:XP_020426984.1 hypothetical protein PPL_11884 [Heterostelium album PN500]
MSNIAVVVPPPSENDVIIKVEQQQQEQVNVQQQKLEQQQQQLSIDDESTIEKIYAFWFGPISLWSKNCNLKTKLWFRRNLNTDSVIKQQFESVLLDVVSSQASGSLYDRWMHSLRGKVALIVLLDQFTRNMYRATPDMFKYDQLALDISLSIIDDTTTTGFQKFQESYSLPERVFINFPLVHSEQLEHVERGYKLMTDVANESQYPNLRKHYVKFARSAQDHVEIIRQFGRYPHRNHLLGRTSSEAEVEFLQTTKYNFVKSVQHANPDNPSKKEDLLGITKPKVNIKSLTTEPIIMDPVISSKPKMKLLFLHGYRQNGPVLKRTTKKLQGFIGDFVTVYYANSPLSINAVNNSENSGSLLTAMASDKESHQRQWWSPSKDFKVYQHIDASIHYLTQLFKAEGPFDGIIGFSQGATFAGILAAMQQQNQLPFRFNFAILISGFPSRADVHQHLIVKNSIDLPTLSIYGTKDEMVENQRTKDLADLFVNPEIDGNDGSHFSPNKWPNHKIRDFLLKQHLGDISSVTTTLATTTIKLNPLDTLNGFNEILDVSLKQLVGKIENNQVLPLFGLTESTRQLLSTSEHFKSILNYDNPTLARELVPNDSLALLIRGNDSEPLLDEILAVAWSTRYNFKTEEPRTTPLFFKLWLHLYLERPNQLLSRLDSFIKYGNYRDLSTLVYFSEKIFDDIQESNIKHLNTLKKTVVKIFADQLTKDYQLVFGSAAQKDEHSESQDNEEEADVWRWPSNCALEAPKLGGGRKGYSSQLAKEISRYLFPMPTLPENATDIQINRGKGLCYEKYRQMVGKLKKLLDMTAPGKVDYNAQVVDKLTYHQNGAMSMTEEERVELLNSNPSSYVLNPEPEPVVPCPLDELDPLINFMNGGGALSDNAPMRFTRGTCMPDGRLDLCKQVVGPEGIRPLLGAMKKSTQIKRLLLGNNIVGNGGGEAIADYIRYNEDSKIDTWYIAGNNFDVDGITPIAEALEKDTKVKALWLKRNPLLTVGVKPIASMLEKNCYLQTLDLLNCGILDQGVEILFNSLRKNTTLKNLYIDTNGLTTASAGYICQLLESGENHLDSLYLSCNRMGDEGAKLISQGLLVDKQLKRLGLGSNGIGPIGAKHLVDAILVHPSLVQLNLGFTRATFQLGAINNVLGDSGAAEIARLIKANTHIRSIDLTHNGISQQGIGMLKDSLKNNLILTSLALNQFGMENNDAARQEINYALGRNRLQWGKAELNGENEDLWMKKGDQLAEEINTPQHIAEILSVYRTK